MLAPDDLRLRSQLGDQTVATTPDDDQPGIPRDDNPPFNRVRGHRVFDVVVVSADGQLVAGEEWVFPGDYQPDGWLISVPNIANVEVEVTIAPSISSQPHARLGPGGSCLLPGRNPSLALKNIGSASVYPVVNRLTNCGDLRWYVNPGVGTMTK